MPDAQTQYVTTIFPQITSLTKVDAVCLLFLLSSTSKLKTVHLQGFWSKTVYLKKTVHLQGFWPKTVYLKCFEIQLKTVYLQGPCSSRPCISRPCCIWIRHMTLLQGPKDPVLHSLIFMPADQRAKDHNNFQRVWLSSSF